ncbi:MAG: metal-dependent hydrolase [bacterium]
MTPLGHVSISYLAGKTSKNISLPAIILGGLLPDIDYVFILAPWFNQIHRLVTHNLLFVSLVALVSFSVTAKDCKKMIFLSLLLGGVLHLFVDACMDANPSNGIGVALLWPIDRNYFFSPFNLLEPNKNGVDWTEPIEYLKFSILAALWEIPLYIISAVILLKKKNHPAFASDPVQSSKQRGTR